MLKGAKGLEEEPRRSRFEPGDYVKWTPLDTNVASTVPLERDHPGRVSEPISPWGVAVDWVDREGPLTLESEYDVDWLTRITPEEFEELSDLVLQKRRAREAAGREQGRTYAPRSST
jgi:hypothetical protein